MDQKQWIITGVLVIVVAVLAFNFDGWTGKATSQIQSTILPVESKIVVSPEAVEAGEEISITVMPSRDPKVCVESELEFYQLKEDGTLGLRTATRDFSNALGTRKNCDTAVLITHKTQTNWEGNYAVTVKDRTTGKKVVSNILTIN